MAVFLGQISSVQLFELARHLAKAMDFFGTPSFLDQDPTWAIDFAPNSTRLGAGDIMTRKRYADILEVITENGTDAFYKGSLARVTIEASKKENDASRLGGLYSSYQEPDCNYISRLQSCTAAAFPRVV